MTDQINKIFDFIKQKSLGNALKASTELVKQNPNSLNINKVHGYVLMICKKFNESEEIFLNLQKKISDDYDILNNLGYIYLQEEKFSNAEKYLNKAIEVNPEGLNAYANMASLKLKIIKYDEALKHYQKYFELLNGEQNYKLEDTTVVLGYLDTLVALDQKLLAKEKVKIFLQTKFNEELFYYYISLDRESAKPEEINNLVKHYETTKEDSVLETKRKLGAILFGAALFYERTDPTLSEKYYYQGNQAISNIQRFMPLNYQRKIKNIKEIYNKYFPLHNNVIENDKGEGLIFIIGLPRSGTTLLESIVANNEFTKSGGELMSMMNLCSQIYSDETGKEEVEDLIIKIGDEYLSRVNSIRGSHKFFIDKLPGNYFNIGFIHACLPKAKFIFIRRNIWDVATSQFKQYYISNVPYSTKFFNIAIECANFEVITNFWMRKEFDIYKNIFEVSYEDLVVHENKVGNEIYNFIGIHSEYQGTGRERFFSRTASRFQIGKKINQKSVNKSFFENDKVKFLQDYKNQLDYWQNAL